MNTESYKESVFNLSDAEEFNVLALELFHFQYKNNALYRQFSDLLKAGPGTVKTIRDIPFLPVHFFKDHPVVAGTGKDEEKIFMSSATGGGGRSLHRVPDIRLYEESFSRGFEYFYGSAGSYRFLALLPSYLEQGDSSLVYMMSHFIRATEKNGSGFYLHDLPALKEKLSEPPPGGVTTLLFGVTYALLDLANMKPAVAGPLIVMETGGMKGRRRELIREEVHQQLREGFNVDTIHSEYGMTELLSQAYSKEKGRFLSPPWMKVLIREMNDPFALAPAGRTGGINIIDLANLHSCGFLATQDLGRAGGDGSFEVLGRFDASDVRGCNLLYVP